MSGVGPRRWRGTRASSSDSLLSPVLTLLRALAAPVQRATVVCTAGEVPAPAAFRAMFRKRGKVGSSGRAVASPHLLHEGTCGHKSGALLMILSVCARAGQCAALCQPSCTDDPAVKKRRHDLGLTQDSAVSAHGGAARTTGALPGSALSSARERSCCTNLSLRLSGFVLCLRTVLVCC